MDPGATRGGEEAGVIDVHVLNVEGGFMSGSRPAVGAFVCAELKIMFDTLERHISCFPFTSNIFNGKIKASVTGRGSRGYLGTRQ